MELCPNEQVHVQAGDHLGFTNLASFGPISFEYMENVRIYFRQVEDTNGKDDYPTVGNNYTFDYIFLPAVFSVAAEIVPGKLVLCQIHSFVFLDDKVHL